jgi:hypothetical protein
VLVAVAVFVPVCVTAPVLTAVPAPPVAVGKHTFTFAAAARSAPVAVFPPLFGLQLAVAAPPTATTLNVLLLAWATRLAWRTLVMRTELRWYER